MTTRIPPEYPSWPPRPDLEDGSQSGETIQIAGNGTVIPVAYAGPWEFKPTIYYAKRHEGVLYLGMAWCWGGKWGIYSVPQLYEGSTMIADGNTILATNKLDYIGVHMGDPDSMVVNPKLQEIEPGYNDNLIYDYKGKGYGVCHTVVGLKDEARISELNCQFHGLEVFDPRIQWHGPSHNPALALADFLTDPVYGCAIPVVNEQSVIDAANYCEEQIDGYNRWRGRQAFLSEVSLSSAVETMRTAANCMVECNGYEARLIPLRPTSVAFSITEDHMQQDSFEIHQLGQMETPTAVTANYVDTRYRPFTRFTVTVEHPDIETGVRPYLESSYETSWLVISGIISTSMVKRFAIQRLNQFNLSNLRATCRVFDEDFEYRLGEVIEVSHPFGLLKKQMRIVGLTLAELGRWDLELEEYDPNIYSDEVGEFPTYPDFGLPDSRVLPTPVFDRLWTSTIGGDRFARAEVDPPSNYDYRYRIEWQLDRDNSGGTNWSSIEAFESNYTRVAFMNTRYSSGAAIRCRARFKAMFQGNYYFSDWTPWESIIVSSSTDDNDA